jgi:hypothetical protein
VANILKPQDQLLISELFAELGVLDACVTPPLLPLREDGEVAAILEVHSSCEEVQAIDEELVGNLAMAVASEWRQEQKTEPTPEDATWIVGSRCVIEFDLTGIASPGTTRYSVSHLERDWLVLGQTSGRTSCIIIAVPCVPLESGQVPAPQLRVLGVKGEVLVSARSGKLINVLPPAQGMGCVSLF